MRSSGVIPQKVKSRVSSFSRKTWHLHHRVGSLTDHSVGQITCNFFGKSFEKDRGSIVEAGRMTYECYNPAATLQRNDNVGSIRSTSNTAPKCETILGVPFSPIVSMCAPFGRPFGRNSVVSPCLLCMPFAMDLSLP